MNFLLYSSVEINEDQSNELEVGTKIRAGVRYQTISDHLGLIITEVILLPGLSLEIAVWPPVSLTYSKLVPCYK